MSNAMKRLHIILEVDDELEIVDKCYREEISHDQEYDRLIPVTDTVNQTVINALSSISIRAKTWSKQKLAEHCNNLLLSHIGYLSKKERFSESCDIYYPYLRLFVYH